MGRLLNFFYVFLCIAIKLDVGIAARNLGVLPIFDELPPLPGDLLDLSVLLPKHDKPQPNLPIVSDLPKPSNLKPSNQNPQTRQSSPKIVQKTSHGSGSPANVRNLGALPLGEGLPPMPDLPFDFPMLPFPFPEGELPKLPRPDLSKFGLPPISDLLNPLDLPNPFERFTERSSQSSSSGSTPSVAKSAQSVTSQMSTPGAGSTMNARNLGALSFGDGMPPLPDLLNPFDLPNPFEQFTKQSSQASSSGSTPGVAKPAQSVTSQMNTPGAGSTMNARNLGALPFGEGMPPLSDLLNPFDLPNPFEQFTKQSSQASSSGSTPGVAKSAQSVTSQMSTPGAGSTSNARNLGALSFGEGMPPLPDLLNPFDLPNPFEQFTKQSSQASSSGSTPGVAKPAQSVTSQMSTPGAGATTNARNLGALPFGEGMPPLSDLLNPFDLPNPFEQFTKQSSQAASSMVPPRNLLNLPGLPPLPQLPKLPFQSPNGEKPRFPRLPHLPNMFPFPKSPKDSSASDHKSGTSAPSQPSPVANQPPNGAANIGTQNKTPAKQQPANAGTNQPPNGVGNPGMPNRNPSTNPGQQQPMPNRNPTMNPTQQQPIGQGMPGQQPKNQPMSGQQQQPMNQGMQGQQPVRNQPMPGQQQQPMNQAMPGQQKPRNQGMPAQQQAMNQAMPNRNPGQQQPMNQPSNTMQNHDMPNRPSNLPGQQPMNIPAKRAEGNERPNPRRRI